MKKIYYLLALAAFAFASCQKEPALLTSTHDVPTSKQALTITLTAADYAKISSGYPKSTLSFDDLADANKYIPQILNSEYVTPAIGSTASVTYTQSSLYFVPDPDSLYTKVAYTLTHADYLLLTGNKYADFEPSQMLAWMQEDTSVYSNSVNNQLALVTFTPYPTTLTPPPPYSYLKLNGTWRQIYTIQPAQYTAAGVGKYAQFSSSNSESSLVSTFNFFLKNDITIADTIKKGDLEFVSFNYYASNDSTYQRVKPLQFDGNNFVAPFTTTATATFVKESGGWVPLPIITHTLTAADITLIANSTAGTSAERSNLSSYGDFSGWSASALDAAMIIALTADYPSPATNTDYDVIYLNYTGGNDVPTTLVFQWSGTAWSAQ
jgi:hypothetical protein